MSEKRGKTAKLSFVILSIVCLTLVAVVLIYGLLTTDVAAQFEKILDNTLEQGTRTAAGLTGRQTGNGLRAGGA